MNRVFLRKVLIADREYTAYRVFGIIDARGDDKLKWPSPGSGKTDLLSVLGNRIRRINRILEKF